jgi:hypothetical protein
MPALRAIVVKPPTAAMSALRLARHGHKNARPRLAGPSSNRETTDYPVMLDDPRRTAGTANETWTQVGAD